jgi:eukaryotic-like serine/threonine-protein kinase
MILTTGTKLGPYEIVALIGVGGMGEVYRARDTKLDRDVAIKILPPAFAADVDRMARFEREAKVLASLNHPNIAHVYSVEERALVMELVEGESPKGPMPLDEAWKVALQVADALEYAHEKSVVHRDLKPANIKVTPEGVVKLLDFGLAKAFSPDPDEAAVEARVTDAPTLTIGATAVGVVLGTAAYMSPEQARGKKVDKRVDIWSWGVVLYELLTGDRLFQRDEAADTLAQVLTKQPDLERVPAKVRRLLAECLQRDARLRLRDIGDAKRLLDSEAEIPPPKAKPRTTWAPWTITGVLAVMCMAMGIVAWRHVHEDPPKAAKLFFPLPNETFQPGRPPSTAVSPDGRHIAFQGVVDGKGQLSVRDLDNPTPHVIDADASGMPFWAPDSRRLAFFAEGKLKKIDLTGGPAVTIADAEATTGGRGPWSGSWNRDDAIVFGRITSPLFRVSAAGGRPVPLTELDETLHETAHFAPWFLPDGHHFLYSAISSDPQKSGVYVADLASKIRRQVTNESTRTIYVTAGYLLFSRGTTLMAQPFDAGKLGTIGEAIPVAEQVDVNNAGVGVAMGFFSASQNGVLVFTSGRVPGAVQFTWVNRAGQQLGTIGAPADVESLALSPDETRIVFARRDLQAGRYELWLRDLERGPESRLTFGGIGSGAVWSADGTHIFYGSRPFDRIYRKAANNTGAEEVVDASRKLPRDASRDGRYLLTTTFNTAKTGLDIWVLPLFGDRKPFPYVQTEFQEDQPKFSPDGRWLAYRSNESKRSEVYVVSFPQLGEKWQISTDGGQSPVWSRDGHELYYYSADGRIMAVEIMPAILENRHFKFGVPRPLFEVRLATSDGQRFEVSRDGRFLLPVLVEQNASTPMTVVLNWQVVLNK